LRETIPFLTAFALSPHQTLSGKKYSSTLQLDAILQVLLILYSKPGWLVLLLLMLIEGELQLHMLVGGVGLAHLPTLVLLMEGAYWRLHN